MCSSKAKTNTKALQARPKPRILYSECDDVLLSATALRADLPSPRNLLTTSLYGLITQTQKRTISTISLIRYPRYRQAARRLPSLQDLSAIPFPPI